MTMRFFRSSNIILSTLSLLLLASCEREQGGALDPDLTAPMIASASLDDETLNLDTTSSGSVVRLPDGTYRVTQFLYASVTNETGIQNLNGVYYRIYKPGAQRYFASGRMSLDSISTAVAATFIANPSFTLNRSDAGLYRVEVYGLSASDEASNYLQIPLDVTRNNSAPRIISAALPDTVFLPPGDSLLIKMSVAVEDSDGTADLAGVYFYSLNSSDPTRQFFLSDDGNAGGLSGDVLAGDGTYTITVKLIDQGDVRRTFEFEFYAIDLQAGESGPLLKYLTVN